MTQLIVQHAITSMDNMEETVSHVKTLTANFVSTISISAEIVLLMALD